MATKAELVAYASSVGVDVSDAWLKADIEAALSDAGYDPTTIGEDDVSEPETYSEEVERTSSDASFSTYRRVDEQREGMDPPYPGPQTLQERGEPTEGGGTVFTANRG